MEIGTGIFLGCVFLGLTYLYVRTGAKWNWKKIILYPIALIILIGICGYLYFRWEGRNKVITELDDIKLNDKISDIIFKNSDIKMDEEDAETKTAQSEKEIYYSNTSKKLAVRVEDGVAKGIIHLCKDNYDYTRINGIGCGDTGEEILKKYGNNIRVLCSMEHRSKLPKVDEEYAKSARVYDAVNYGVRHLMWHNKVDGFFIADTKSLGSYKGKSWDDCK